MDALHGAITDPDAFVALYRRESPMLLTFCARRVLDAEVALDLVAETFAQAFKGRRSFAARRRSRPARGC